MDQGDVSRQLAPKMTPNRLQRSWKRIASLWDSHGYMFVAGLLTFLPIILYWLIIDVQEQRGLITNLVAGISSIGLGAILISKLLEQRQARERIARQLPFLTRTLTQLLIEVDYVERTIQRVPALLETGRSQNTFGMQLYTDETVKQEIGRVIDDGMHILERIAFVIQTQPILFEWLPPLGPPMTDFYIRCSGLFQGLKNLLITLEVESEAETMRAAKLEHPEGETHILDNIESFSDDFRKRTLTTVNDSLKLSQEIKTLIINFMRQNKYA